MIVMKKIKALYEKHKDFVMEVIHFGMVGVINTLMGWGIMAVLYNLAHMNYWLSSGISYFIGSIFSYHANAKVTFKVEDKERDKALPWRFAINIIVCYLVAFSLAQPFVKYILSFQSAVTIVNTIAAALGMESAAVVDNIAMVFGMGLFIIMNFFGQKLFVFRKVHKTGYKLHGLVFIILFGASVCMMGCGSQGMNEAEAAETDENLLETKEQAEMTQNQNMELQKESGALKASQPEETIQRKLSVLGDSISTFATWIPEGYNCFYPESGELASVDQTWWKMVLDDMDMELCANASSSGSTCVGNSLGTDDPQHGCSDFRIADLMGKSGTYPDVIIVYMGTNDCLNAIPLGDNDGTQYVEEGNIDNFSDAYSLILDKLAANYPVADIFCCNLAPIGDWGTKRTFEIMVNGRGLTSEDYSRQIEVIAAAKGCPVIDLQHCGITIDNMPQYITDGVHLNPDGMKLVRDAVETVLLDYYQ